jgi:hypothetical protein
MHAQVDRILDREPLIREEADGRVWPSDVGYDRQPGGGRFVATGEIVGGSEVMVAVTSVEAVAFRPDRFGDWLLELTEARSLLRRVDALGQVLIPVEKARNTGRVNEVEVCVKCGEPIGDKVHRVDGHALCANTCYYRLYRVAQGRRVNITTVVAELVRAAGLGDGK